VDRPAVDLDVLQGDPAASRVGDGEVAQQFLDRAGDQRGVLGVAQGGELVGVLEQCERAERDHVGGRLMAGGQQQRRHQRRLAPR
jgi:hypothetical protein